MSYFNHITFKLLMATFCLNAFHAQANEGAPVSTQEGIEFYYFAHGNNNTTHDFEISFTVNDPAIKEAYFTTISDLKVVVEYQDLNQHNQTSFTPVQTPKSFKNVGEYFFGEIKLEGLQAYTPYRARIRFIAPQTNGTYKNIGAVSKWYYTATTGTDSAQIAQVNRILKKFHDIHASPATLISQNQILTPYTEDATLCLEGTTPTCEEDDTTEFLANPVNPILIAQKSQISLVITQ